MLKLVVKPEYSDFFSQWKGGKMKIQLEKPAVNNLKVYEWQK